MLISDWSSDVCSSDLRHLMTVRFHIYGSVDYLKRRGIPQTLEDLKDHDLIVYGTEARAPIENVNWLLEIGDPAPGERNVILSVNNQYAIYRAVRSGLGLAALPDFMVDQNLNVVKVRSEEHTSELQSLMRTSYAVFCLKKKNT